MTQPILDSYQKEGPPELLSYFPTWKAFVLWSPRKQGRCGSQVHFSWSIQSSTKPISLRCQFKDFSKTDGPTPTTLSLNLVSQGKCSTDLMFWIIVLQSSSSCLESSSSKSSSCLESLSSSCIHYAAIHSHLANTSRGCCGCMLGWWSFYWQMLLIGKIKENICGASLEY